MGNKKTIYYSIALNVLFTIGVLTVIIILSALAFDKEKLYQTEFWLSIIINGVALIYLFGNYKYTNIRLLKTKDKGYQKVNIMHSKMCDYIKANNIRDKAEEHISIVNKKNLKESQETYLERITSVFTLDEVINLTQDELSAECQKKGFNKKQTKKLLKVVEKIKNGKVKYIRYTIHEILNNPSSTSVNKQVNAKSEKWITLGEFISKFLTYVCFTAMFSVLIWTGNVEDLIKEIAVRVTLVISAIQSGLKSATYYVGRAKDRLVNKNDILAEVEGIDYAKIENETNIILISQEKEKAI